MFNYDISSIKNGLNECLQLVQTTSMKQLSNVIISSISKLDEPMQLAIIGRISSSKSTLVNAILGKEELMTTGQKEVTYNVGWLKYGEPESDIVVHYKDGRPPMRKSQAEFSKLSIESNDADINNISYIETFDNSEILREINIIDTPGLDANRKIDSQNTLDFLSKVRPDAVLMLFTHAVAENTLDVVRQFNTGASLTPLNAIGVLAKIDVYWHETFPRDKSALQIAQKMVNKRKSDDMVLKKTLFDLYPISALLFLASTTVTDDDIQDIRKAYENDPLAFSRSLNSADKFMYETSTCISQYRRKDIFDKMGIYGIHLIVQCLKQGQSVDLQEIKRLFRVESGAEQFMKTLYNHFGSRAKLIKIESVYQHIQQTIHSTRALLRDNASLRLLSRIEQQVSDVFSSLVHEHVEYELLNKIYNSQLDLGEDVKQEILHLCGEYGNSALERLNMPQNTPVDELKGVALCRERFWRKQIALEPDPEERQWMNVVLKSSSNLRHQIETMDYQYKQAQAFLFNK